jgi:heme oxygenase
MKEFRGAKPSTIDPQPSPADTPIREILRAATQGPHERLHVHAGFSSVKAGTITLEDYRALLIRLYGFYLPFERAVGGEDLRTQWLANDLACLGADAVALSRIPLCTDFPSYHGPENRLGALYVVEGSALGGRQLSRGLDRLLGEDPVEGRRFFAGRGAGTGDAWVDFLARLASVGSEPQGRAALVRAAIETFELFEIWLSGWSETR